MEQNLKYILHTSDGFSKYMDGELQDCLHIIDRDLSKISLCYLDYWGGTYNGLLDSDEYLNDFIFGNNVEEHFQLL